MNQFSKRNSFTLRQAPFDSAQGKQDKSSLSSFTLIELLIVIGILAILTAAVVIVLNPSELLKQGRDSTRMTDLASLNKTIQLLLTQNPQTSLGTASTVYISLPDTSPTCSNLGLPALPSGYSYKCVSSASSTLSNGQGWLPIDFSTSGIQNLAKLPLDPANSSSAGLYYTYMLTNNNTYELTTLVESEKGSKTAISDGGSLPGVLEIGSSISQTPTLRDRGLVGYWTLNEGTGTTTYDRSGINNNGTLINGPLWQNANNCKKGGCLSFDGTQTVSILDNNSLDLQNGWTLSGWVYVNSTELGYGHIVGKRSSDTNYAFRTSSAATYWECYFYKDGGWKVGNSASGTVIKDQWLYMSCTYDGNNIKIYKNDSLLSSVSVGGSASADTNDVRLGGWGGGNGSETLDGRLDEVRIYNRALSESEISAVYNATK